MDECPAAILEGPPASGKTSLISQVVMHLLLMGELVPIPIKVQQLQRRLLESPSAFATCWNWIDAYLRLEHGGGAVYRMLRQAMASRRAIILLDGLDEGGALRDEIERHVAEVLAPQGHVMLATSRPAGLDKKRFASFRQLALAPLTEAQQTQVLKERLGADRAQQLLPYLDRLPSDTETGLRVTANPVSTLHNPTTSPAASTNHFRHATASLVITTHPRFAQNFLAAHAFDGRLRLRAAPGRWHAVHHR